MDLGKSLREIFQAPIRYMKGSLEKESVFEKPYRFGEGYREMHYKPPGPNGERPRPIKYPECGTLLAIEYGECDYAVVMWKKDHWSPPLPLGYPDKGTWTVASSKCDGVPCFDYIMSHFDSATYTVGQGTLEGGPGIKFKINPLGAIPDETDGTIGHCHFHITHKTEWGEVCSWEWHIECPLECTEVDLVVLCSVAGIQLGYGSSCDEIAREGAAAVYVGGALGGEPEYPPYKWAITGTGFHFDAMDGPTTGQTDTAAETILIYADATACGTGTVTVTDACGNTGTDYIRSDGQWVLCYSQQFDTCYTLWISCNAGIEGAHLVGFYLCYEGGTQCYGATCDDDYYTKRCITDSIPGSCAPYIPEEEPEKWRIYSYFIYKWTC